MRNLEITYVDPRTLIKNPWNPNEVDPINQEKIRHSLKTKGWIRPIMVRETPDGLQILGGAHRTDAAVELGHQQVPVTNLGPLSDGDAKLFGQIDNARYGTDAIDKLAELFGGDDIGTAEDLLAVLPIDDAELASYFEHAALDDLDLDDQLDDDDEIDLSDRGSATKTHQILRFKVGIDDAERLGDLIARTKKEQGLTDSDDLTNSGDALVWLINQRTAA